MMIRIRPALVLCAVAAAVLGGCSGGDFGRVRDDLVLDNIHEWVGPTAAVNGPGLFSDYPLTDDERTLRDLAYPLIEPAYERQRWYSVLNEYGIGRLWRHDWSRFDASAYVRQLAARPFRSEKGRYDQLNDDIRNDSVRIEPFFKVAARVLLMDDKREQSLAVLTTLSRREQMSAFARIDENALVISWVQWSLVARALSYRFALEHLAVAAPMPAVGDVERSLVMMQNLIGYHRILPGPDLAPGPGIVVPRFEGPRLGPNGRPARTPQKPLSVLG